MVTFTCENIVLGSCVLKLLSWLFGIIPATFVFIMGVAFFVEVNGTDTVPVVVTVLADDTVFVLFVFVNVILVAAYVDDIAHPVSGVDLSCVLFAEAAEVIVAVFDVFLVVSFAAVFVVLDIVVVVLLIGGVVPWMTTSWK